MKVSAEITVQEIMIGANVGRDRVVVKMRPEYVSEVFVADAIVADNQKVVDVVGKCMARAMLDYEHWNKINGPLIGHMTGKSDKKPR